MKLPIRTRDKNINFTVRMTPLIDVIFLLMIFFIMTIRFVEPEGILENRLPKKAGQDINDQKNDWEVVRIKIKLVQDGNQFKIYLQERVLYSYDDLRSYLDLLPDKILIVIEPDLTVPYKYVIGIYNTCLKSEKKDIVFTVAQG